MKQWFVYRRLKGSRNSSGNFSNKRKSRGLIPIQIALIVLGVIVLAVLGGYFSYKGSLIKKEIPKEKKIRVNTNQEDQADNSPKSFIQDLISEVKPDIVATTNNLLFSGNTNLYRLAANTLKTDDKLEIDSDLPVYEDGSTNTSLTFDADAVNFAITKNLTSTWTQVNTDGFGAPVPFTYDDFFSWEVFNGCLYAGVERHVAGGFILYHTCDGTTWTESGFPETIGHLVSLKVFKGWLYTPYYSRAHYPVAVYRTRDGTNWTQVNIDGFGDNNTANWYSLTTFKGWLCGGTWNSRGGIGAAVWCTRDGTTYVKKSSDGFGDANNYAIRGLQVFNGYLYASTQNNSGAQLYRTNDLENWTQVTGDAFGYGASTDAMRSMVVFRGALYIAARNGSGQLVMKRSYDGTNFSDVYNLTDTNNTAVSGLGLIVYNGQLYFATKNEVTGTEIWRTSNGTDFEQFNTDGFDNDTGNIYANLCSYKGYLYAGTGNFSTGQEVWRMRKGGQINNNIQTPNPK